MLATVQGALAGSSSAEIVPWLVVIVRCSEPDLGMLRVGGRPTDLALVSVLVSTAVHAQSSGLTGAFLKPPAAQIVPRTTRASTTAPPMPACHWRRLRATAALRAIWRSALARARARCRLLLVATEHSLQKASWTDKCARQSVRVRPPARVAARSRFAVPSLDKLA